nr:hypothetical protein [Nitrobacter sp.]
MDQRPVFPAEQDGVVRVIALVVFETERFFGVELRLVLRRCAECARRARALDGGFALHVGFGLWLALQHRRMGTSLLRDMSQFMREEPAAASRLGSICAAPEGDILTEREGARIYFIGGRCGCAIEMESHVRETPSEPWFKIGALAGRELRATTENRLSRRSYVGPRDATTRVIRALALDACIFFFIALRAFPLRSRYRRAAYGSHCVTSENGGGDPICFAL